MRTGVDSKAAAQGWLNQHRAAASNFHGILDRHLLPNWGILSGFGKRPIEDPPQAP